MIKIRIIFLLDSFGLLIDLVCPDHNSSIPRLPASLIYSGGHHRRLSFPSGT